MEAEISQLTAPWQTCAGELELAIPKFRRGSYPSFLEARKRSEQALVSVVQEAYVARVSTRKGDRVVGQDLEERGLLHCWAFDKQVDAFAGRLRAPTATRDAVEAKELLAVEWAGPAQVSARPKGRACAARTGLPPKGAIRSSQLEARPRHVSIGAFGRAVSAGSRRSLRPAPSRRTSFRPSPERSGPRLQIGRAHV